VKTLANESALAAAIEPEPEVPEEPVHYCVCRSCGLEGCSYEPCCNPPRYRD
jgi:hypothetical protein